MPLWNCQVSHALTGAAALNLHHDNQRDLIEMAIARAWLDQWYEPAMLPQIQDAWTGNTLLFVTDHSRQRHRHRHRARRPRA